MNRLNERFRECCDRMLSIFRIIGIPFVIAVLVLTASNYFGEAFWANFSSDALATFLGIILGIPAAVWLSRYQEGRAEEERADRILSLLQEELDGNQYQLDHWNPQDMAERALLSSTLAERLGTELWVAFSDGGELEWIKDPGLLGTLAKAYRSIQAVQSLSDKFYAYHQFRNRWSDKNARKHLNVTLEQRISKARKDIEIALNSVEKVLTRQEET